MGNMHISTQTDLRSAIIGGLTIGVAASGLFIFNKTTSGISGVLRSTIFSAPKLVHSSYILGLVTSGMLLKMVKPDAFGPENSVRQLSANGAALAGVLVGFGASLSNGCTSGHGVCGLPRLSPRSLVAVMTFMASGMITAITFRDSKFLYGIDTGSKNTIVAPVIAICSATVAFSFLPRIFGHLIDMSSDLGPIYVKDTVVETMTGFASAVVFGLGLGFSGMTNPGKVIGFLDLTNPSGWDPSLMGVMGGAVLFNEVAFQGIARISDDHKRAVNLQPSFASADLFNWKLILGSTLFGCGWVRFE